MLAICWLIVCLFASSSLFVLLCLFVLCAFGPHACLPPAHQQHYTHTTARLHPSALAARETFGPCLETVLERRGRSCLAGPKAHAHTHSHQVCTAQRPPHPPTPPTHCAPHSPPRPPPPCTAQPIHLSTSSLSMKTAALLTVSSLMGASAFMAPAPKFSRTRGVARMSFEDEAGVTAPLGYWVSPPPSPPSPQDRPAHNTHPPFPPPIPSTHHRTPLASPPMGMSKSLTSTAPPRSSTAEVRPTRERKGRGRTWSANLSLPLLPFNLKGRSPPSTLTPSPPPLPPSLLLQWPCLPCSTPW